VLAEAAPPCAAAKTGIIVYGERVGTTPKRMHRYGAPSLETSREKSPVIIIAEWISGTYFCDPDTPESTVQFLQYLQEQGLGLKVGVWGLDFRRLR
jgi:hypothetical protein